MRAGLLPLEILVSTVWLCSPNFSEDSIQNTAIQNKAIQNKAIQNKASFRPVVAWNVDRCRPLRIA
ncbi:MAG: hypothetical protein VXY07_05510 [Planctomycetota bacterium]|nr:hypothetical protein [Planctomycetota bacterium]MEC8782265.1 hypothetical protein [Planctomycetota bacterium]